MKTGCFLFFACAVFLFSCSSVPEKKTGGNFLGDFDPVRLGSVMSVNDTVFSGLKAREIELFFVPRRNTVEMYFRDSVNKAALVLSYENRRAILDSAVLYFSAYESGTFEDRKPSAKNAFMTDKTSVSWGVAGLARNGIADIYTNWEFLETSKPYFLLSVGSASDTGDPSVYSPALKFYFSPSQLREFTQYLDQQNLLDIVSGLEDRAFSFDSPYPEDDAAEQ